MIAAVVDLNFEVYHFVARKEAVSCRAADTLIDCGDIFLGDRAADRKVFEHVARAGFAGNHMELAVTVLTFTARLTLVHTFAIDCLTDGFAVSNLRCADVCFYLELS